MPESGASVDLAALTRRVEQLGRLTKKFYYIKNWSLTLTVL
jgi:hypothetical protein